MSGEYYYGGVTVLLLFAAFAVAGSERWQPARIVSDKDDRDGQRGKRATS
jgi:hypothetical protein